MYFVKKFRRIEWIRAPVSHQERNADPIGDA